jgi:hypothetical protein
LPQGKPGVFPEATMPCPILRQNLPMAARNPDAAKRNPGTIAPTGRLIPGCTALHPGYGIDEIARQLP